MPSANGPCRFGQYHRFHRLILDELGYPQVPVYSPEQSENMYREIGMVGGDFDRVAWNGIVAIDLLDKKLRACRPYERTPGESDQGLRSTTCKKLTTPCATARMWRRCSGRPGAPSTI